MPMPPEASADTWDAIIVGAGAAGCFAACRLARLQPGWRILLLEAGRQPLAKVRISGGGRCNVTHRFVDIAHFVSHYPRGQRELVSVLKRFGPTDTVQWFESRGVPLKTEPDGRLFPVSDNSQTLIDCLLGELKMLGVSYHTQQAVTALGQKDSGVWQLSVRNNSTNNQQLMTPRLLLATGGNPTVWRWLETLGLPLIPPVPSLFTFTLADLWPATLSGVSLPTVRLSLPAFGKSCHQSGPLLFTHWGLSGPAVLRLSAWAARSLHDAQYQANLHVDWLPEQSWADLGETCLAFARTHPQRQLATQPPVALPKRFWSALISALGLDPALPWAQLSKAHCNHLVEGLKRCSLTLTAKGVFKEEFVIAGGVDRHAVNFQTMASRTLSGLFLAGELLDIDGLTGGFNLQNAWSTGWVAAGGMAGYE